MSDAAENEDLKDGEGQADTLGSAPNDGDAGQAGGDEAPSFEDRALAMGWTPKSQFKGDPDRWVDAETFVKRGEEFLPFLKANNKRLEQALDRTQKQLDQTRADLKQFGEFHSKTAEREYRRAFQDIQARLDEAAAAGDVQGVREATQELVDLSSEAKADAKPSQQQGDTTEFAAFKADNAWYGSDKAMSAAFDALCREVFEEGYTSPKAGLKEATSRLKEAFPEKFAKPENPNRRSPAAVEGAGAPARPRGKTRSDLPADARATMDRWVKQGLVTEASYLKDYFGQ